MSGVSVNFGRSSAIPARKFKSKQKKTYRVSPKAEIFSSIKTTSSFLPFLDGKLILNEKKEIAH